MSAQKPARSRFSKACGVSPSRKFVLFSARRPRLLLWTPLPLWQKQHVSTAIAARRLIIPACWRSQRDVIPCWISSLRRNDLFPMIRRSTAPEDALP